MFKVSILSDDAADRIIHHFIILKCSGQVLPPAVCGCSLIQSGGLIFQVALHTLSLQSFISLPTLPSMLQAGEAITSKHCHFGNNEEVSTILFKKSNFSRSSIITAIGNQLSSLACLIESGNTITEWDLKYFHLFGIRKLLGATLCNPSLTALATADSYIHSTQGRKNIVYKKL
jgi:hypothetical protein